MKESSRDGGDMKRGRAWVWVLLILILLALGIAFVLYLIINKGGVFSPP